MADMDKAARELQIPKQLGLIEKELGCLHNIIDELNGRLFIASSNPQPEVKRESAIEPVSTTPYHEEFCELAQSLRSIRKTVIEGITKLKGMSKHLEF